jgi:hypothetical protein
VEVEVEGYEYGIWNMEYGMFYVYAYVYGYINISEQVGEWRVPKPHQAPQGPRPNALSLCYGSFGVRSSSSDASLWLSSRSRLNHQSLLSPYFCCCWW